MQVLSWTKNQTGNWTTCELDGIPLSGDRHLGNLGKSEKTTRSVVVHTA
jgi:hypothetical protein